MSDLNIPILERPSFFDGQRLTAADLAFVQEYHQQLRWLHNRSLHNWGIALGFAVSGARGDKLVMVQAGYALDCLGRDLISNQALTLPIPAVAGDAGKPVTYFLTASYAEDASLTPEIRLGLCGASGAVRRPEAPIIRWQKPDDTEPPGNFRRGLDIVLASIQVQNCQLARDVSAAERRDALPAQQPYVFASQTESGTTVWKPWPDAKAPSAVVTTVSTVSAGFRGTPRYQANVVGERLMVLKGKSFIADGYAQIATATASSFDLRVFLPTGATVGDADTVQVTQEDFVEVAEVIAGRAGVDLSLLLAFAGGVFDANITIASFVNGTHLLTRVTPAPATDFALTLPKIAARKNISAAILLADNPSLNRRLEIGEFLVVAGKPLELNPKESVFSDLFMNAITQQWHVVWEGVEGG